MPTVPPKFGKEAEGRKLRLFFSDGEVSEGIVIEAPAHDDCEGCNGFVYDLLSTDRPAKYEAMHVKIGSAQWSSFDALEKYEVLEGSD
jgi:hypothetical protein